MVVIDQLLAYEIGLLADHSGDVGVSLWEWDGLLNPNSDVTDAESICVVDTSYPHPAPLNGDCSYEFRKGNRGW
jgi:hypothetical protein